MVVFLCGLYLVLQVESLHAAVDSLNINLILCDIYLGKKNRDTILFSIYVLVEHIWGGGGHCDLDHIINEIIFTYAISAYNCFRMQI